MHPSKLSCPFFAAAALVATGFVPGLSGSSAHAQSTPDFPRGEFIPHPLDSGPHDNPGARPVVVFDEVIHTPDGHWARLYFSELILDGTSFIRVTSLLDGEVQELDAAAARMWNNTTAYFNGDSLRLQLVAGPGTVGNRVSMLEMAAEINVAMPVTLCGLCGQDTRVPSSELWAGRLMPVGCSAAVWNECSCIVSAGHCMQANLVMQFNVPNSTPGCALVNPPTADQFPVTSFQHSNAGPGGDWAVGTTGFNNQAQTIYQRYGEFRPIASSAPGGGNPINIWGYGASKTCTLNQTQQMSAGNIIGIFATSFSHNADATSGNSGSAVIRNGEIIGIVTHCQQPCPPGVNIAQRIDTPAFATARANLCTCGPPNDCCSQSILLGEGVHAFHNNAATTCGPDEPQMCDIFGDTQVQSDVWFHHLTECTGNLTVSLCGSDFTTKLALYGGLCPSQPGTAIACDVTGCPTSSRSEIIYPVTQGQAIRIRVGGQFGAQGDGTLTITCTAGQDPCPADLNDSGAVDVQDLLMLLAAWGPCPGCPEDLNNSGAVDVQDLLILLAEWGPCP